MRDMRQEDSRKRREATQRALEASSSLPVEVLSHIVAAKLNNLTINRITFKTLRHYKGTMEYHRTKDILHVMEVLGHKNIKNTLVYTHLVNFLTTSSQKLAKKLRMLVSL